MNRMDGDLIEQRVKESDLIKVRFCPLFGMTENDPRSIITMDSVTQTTHTISRQRESENNPISHTNYIPLARSQTRFHSCNHHQMKNNTNKFSHRDGVFIFVAIHCSKSLDDIIFMSAREFIFFLFFCFVLVQKVVGEKIN